MHIDRLYLPCRFGQLHARLVAPPGEDVRSVPLVCLHGLPDSGVIFTRLLPLLGTDRVVLAIDLPGYGMSDPVEGPDRLEDYADAIEDAVTALGAPVVDLLGTHTGVAVSVELGARDADRWRRLVLLGVPMLSEAERQAVLAPIPYDHEGEWLQAEWQRTLRRAGPGQTDEDLRQAFAEKLRPGVRERGFTAALAYDVAARLPALKQRVTLVRARDGLWDATERARALLPRAGWAELPEYGVGVFEVAPERVAAVVREGLDGA